MIEAHLASDEDNGWMLLHKAKTRGISSAQTMRWLLTGI